MSLMTTAYIDSLNQPSHCIAEENQGPDISRPDVDQAADYKHQFQANARKLAIVPLVSQTNTHHYLQQPKGWVGWYGSVSPLL